MAISTLYKKIINRTKIKKTGDAWKYDKLDSLEYARDTYAGIQATRKALSRCNKHIYRNGIHTKTTTLRRGYIGELATHDFFTENKDTGYRVVPIKTYNHRNLTFSQQFIPGISGFQFQEHLLDIELNDNALWESKGKYCAELFVNELCDQQHKFHKDHKAIFTKIGKYIKEVENNDSTNIPVCTYEIQETEHIKRLIENYEEEPTLNHLIKTLEPEISKLARFLQQNSNSFFRDASPINFMIPNRSLDYPDGLPRTIKRFGDTQKIKSAFKKWLHKTSPSSLKKLSKNILQVDFEQVGLKQTNEQDDFIHILALNNSPSIRDKYIKSHLKALSNEEKILFHMTMIFRTPREGARRIKFIMDETADKEEAYTKHYNYLNMNDDFRHLFKYAIESIDECSRLTSKKLEFPNLRRTFDIVLGWLNEHENEFFNLIPK